VTAKDIDDYLARVPPGHRSLLVDLRTALVTLLPDAEQCISYSVPCFKVAGKGVAGFGFAKDHCTYFPMSGSITTELAGELHGYLTSKGSVQFSADRPLPRQLVKELVQARLREIGGYECRLATEADVADVVGTLAAGFAADPVWGLWAFPDSTDRAGLLVDYWRPFVDAGLRYDGVFMTPHAEAVSVWIPPGVPEMDDENEAAFEAVVTRLLGDRAPLLHGAFEAFEANRPKDVPHWYLSLLATHPDHRGKGLGMRLVADVLARVDGTHLPAHLESTNPANEARYERAGFQRSGAFTIPSGPTVTTMWRPAR
jgi:uncharacterized protein YdhG (YjbR/CyaY superfamily)/ribosomal protein S18 acetylase RimI-like enzyme